MKIILLRGLNTYQDDNLRLGWLNFGDWYQSIEPHLNSRGYETFAIRKMGCESFEAQTQRATSQIIQLIEETPSSFEGRQIVLLGQSTGGLIARMLAHEPRLTSKIHSVLTLSTPHWGLPAADRWTHWEQNKTWKTQALKLLNYNLDFRSSIIQQFSTENMRQWNQSYPNLYGIQYKYIQCESPPESWSWPLQMGRFLYFDKTKTSPSDGLVPIKSQAKGNKLGTFALDHFGGFGHFLQVSRSQRNAARREFHRLIEHIDIYLNSFCVKSE